MRRFAVGIFLGLALLLFGSTSFAQEARTLDERFDVANQAYFEGDHEGATALYEELVTAGVDDPDVYFNLASAYAEQGDYGLAVGYFERTLRLSPSDDDAETGLNNARDALAAAMARTSEEVILDTGPPFGEALVSPFRESTLAVLFLIANFLFCLGIGLFIFLRLERPRSSARITLGLGVLTTGLLFFLLGGALLAKNGWFSDGQEAVVVRVEQGLREGPDPRAAARGRLYEGERATILAEDGEYRRIRASSGREGWVHEREILSISHPH